MRKIVLAAAAAAVFSLSVPLTAAAAAPSSLTAVSAVSAQADDNYTPNNRSVASLTGSAVGSCNGGTAIDYTVTLADPSNTVTDRAATLVLSSGSRSVDVPLGTVSNGSLSGSVAWPAAQWSREGVSARIAVGGLTAAVAPPTAMDCSQPSALSALATTGLGTAVWPVAIAGGALALAGGILLAVRRRVRH